MSVSDEEFQRFQNQLLDLKTLNYQFEEKNRKLVAGSNEKTFIDVKTFVFLLRKSTVEKSNRKK